MENQKLAEIKKNLTALPVLQQRLKNLEQSIVEAEEEMQELLNKYKSETFDVEQMKRDSLSNTLYRMIKKYDAKLEKETAEMLAAKLEYDKASDRVASLNSERDELKGRISVLLENKHAYETELKNREESVKRGISNEAFEKYKKLEAEHELLSRQLLEIEEAIRAAQNVNATADKAMDHLISAEGWATYDVWARGGILSHMIKYDHIDNAQEAFNVLSSQIKDLNRELADVSIIGSVEEIGIDSTTRMFDFWFDNIFTDLNVREKIRDDEETLDNLRRNIKNIINRLERNKLDIHMKMKDVENQKDDLLISLDTKL